MQEKEEAELLQTLLLFHRKGFKKGFEALKSFSSSTPALKLRAFNYMLHTLEKPTSFLQEIPLSERESDMHVDAELARLHLLNNSWKAAAQILEKYPVEALSDETLPLYVPMGCLLWHQEGKEIALSHFSTGLNDLHPPTTALLGYFLHKKIEEDKLPFFWERIELFRQLHLFYHCTKQNKKKQSSLRCLQKELRRHRSLQKAYTSIL